jgi:hypothetical protein
MVCGLALCGTAGCGEGEVPIGEAGAAVAIGEWAGYIENVQFQSGSDAIHMNVTGSQGDQIEGVVTFGAGSPPPVAVDPDVGYPTGPACGYQPGVTEGFAYTVLAGNMSVARLEFGIDARELWKTWCELQTSYEWGADGPFSCLPNASVIGGDENGCYLLDEQQNSTPVDCCKQTMCFWDQVCECHLDGCGIELNGAAIRFDLTIDGDAAVGSVGGEAGIGGAGLIRMLRTP